VPRVTTQIIYFIHLLCRIYFQVFDNCVFSVCDCLFGLGQEHTLCWCQRCFTPDWVLSSSSICSAPLRSRTAQWSGGDLFLFCFGIKRRPSGRCGVGCEPSQTVAVDKRTQREHFELHCSQLTSAALKSEASKIIVWSKWDSCIFVECGLPQCCTCRSRTMRRICVIWSVSPARFLPVHASIRTEHVCIWIHIY